MKKRLFSMLSLLIVCVMMLGLPVVGNSDGMEAGDNEFVGDGNMLPFPGGHGENNDQPPEGNGDAGDEPTAPGTTDDRIPTVMETFFIFNEIADINETIYIEVFVRLQDEDDEYYGNRFFWPEPLILFHGNEVGDVRMMGMGFICIVEASELGYGVHELVVYYPGDDEYAPCETAVQVTVRKKLRPNVVDFYPSVSKTGEPYTFGGRLVDEDGAPIVGSGLRIWVPIDIGYVSGNYFYVVTDANGAFSCEVPWCLPTKEGTLELIVRSDDDVNLLDVDNYRYIRFSDTVYTVDLSVEPAGAGVVHGAGAYAPDEQIALSAEANPGWIFKGWRMEGSSLTVQNNPYTMSARNAAATAVFEAIPVEHIELNSHPDYTAYTVYTGRELVVRGRLTDDLGNTAATVGTVRASWDAPEGGEALNVEHGEFSYTAVPSEPGFRNLWFTYYDENDDVRFAVSVRFEILENYIVDVNLNSEGFKTEYLYGEELDLSGLFIEIGYTDGSTVSIPVTEDMISRSISGYLGAQRITIRYVDEDGYPLTFEVVVNVSEEQKVYTVSFVTGDVCPAPAQRTTGWDNFFGNVLGESVYIEPANSEEYEFCGWFFDEECSESAYYHTHVTDDVTLYALWEGPKALITEVELTIAQPKAGDRVRFFSIYDENSDPLEACGAALGGDSVGKVRIVHAFWAPILETYDWNDPAWHTFVPGVDYELQISLEPEEGCEAFFKGHKSAYDEDWNFDPSKAFVLTVNDLYDQSAIGSVNSSYAYVAPVFRVHPLAKGDVNKDGKVDITDVTVLLNALAGGAFDIHIVDLDENGALSISDVTALLNLLAQ